METGYSWDTGLVREINEDSIKEKRKKYYKANKEKSSKGRSKKAENLSDQN